MIKVNEEKIIAEYNAALESARLTAETQAQTEIDEIAGVLNFNGIPEDLSLPIFDYVRERARKNIDYSKMPYAEIITEIESEIESEQAETSESAPAMPPTAEVKAEEKQEKPQINAFFKDVLNSINKPINWGKK